MFTTGISNPFITRYMQDPQGIISDELEAESMAFYHTEGCRREIGENNKVDTAAYHKYIEDLVTQLIVTGC